MNSEEKILKVLSNLVHCLHGSSPDQISNNNPSLLPSHLESILEFNSSSSSSSLEGENHPFTGDKGMSLLDVKNHTLLSYLTHLLFYCLLKVRGISLSQFPEVVEGLIRHRITLQKLKPLESKLSYTIQKLVKQSLLESETKSVKSAKKESFAGMESVDPLAFKPNPGNLMNSDEKEFKMETEKTMDMENGNSEKGQESGVYRPPRLMPMPYMDVTELEARSKLSARAKERASRSRLLQDLAQEFDDRPEALSVTGSGSALGSNAHSHDDSRTWAEREAFEEATFTRLPLSRKDKAVYKRLAQRERGLERFESEFGDLNRDFAELSSGVGRAVEAEAQRERMLGGKRKRLEGLAEAPLKAFTTSQKNTKGKSIFQKAIKKQRKLQAKSR